MENCNSQKQNYSGHAIEACCSSGASPPEEKAAKEILAFLATQSRPCDERQILAAIRGRKQAKVVALRKLFRINKIKRNGSGTKHDVYLYFLPPQQHSVENQREVLSESNQIATALAGITPSESTIGSDSSEGVSKLQDTDTEHVPEGAEPIYKRYPMPDGSILTLTRSEFDRVVDNIRILRDRDIKNSYGAKPT